MSYLSDTRYDTIYKIYNGNKQEVHGTTIVETNPDNMYNITFEGGLNQHTGYKFRDCEKSTINYAGHDNTNPIERVLCSYANGVKVIEKSAVEQINDKYYWGHIVYMVDKDDQYIDINGEVGAIITDTPSSTIFNSYEVDSLDVESWYTISGYGYTGDESMNAYSFSSLGNTFLAKPTASPYDRPDLTGNISEQRVGTYYYTPSTGTRITSDELLGLFFDAIVNHGDGTNIKPISPSDDTSGPGGGDDDDPHYDPFSDPIDFPNLPIGGAIDSGMVRVYKPTSGELHALAGKLWSDDFAENIKKIMNDPMEAVISLHCVPFTLSGSSATCQIGNYNTNISMEAITSQYYTVDMGSIRIPEHWASALDYDPYVTIECHLPFIGIKPLRVDDIVGRTITIKYNIDIVSGSAVCFVKCDDSVLYEINTVVSMEIPLTMSSNADLIRSVMSGVGNVVLGGATGGIGGAVGGAMGSALNVALSKHTTVSRSGSISGTHGFLSDYIPYLIIHRPIQSLASGFAHFKGYPSNITGVISSVSGYTEVESVHLTGIPCTDAERDEIMALLYNGVIV